MLTFSRWLEPSEDHPEDKPHKRRCCHANSRRCAWTSIRIASRGSHEIFIWSSQGTMWKLKSSKVLDWNQLALFGVTGPKGPTAAAGGPSRLQPDGRTCEMCGHHFIPSLSRWPHPTIFAMARAHLTRHCRKIREEYAHTRTRTLQTVFRGCHGRI